MTNQEVTTNIFFLEALCRTKDKKYKKDQKQSISLVKKHYHTYTTPNFHEKRMAKIIKFGLFPAYKAYVRYKYYR